MSINPNMANREVVDFVLCDYKTKKPFLNLDFANVSSTEMQATRVIAYGGRGRAPRVPFDGERTATMTVETQITPMKLFALLSGGDVETTAKVFKREVLTLAENKLTLTETPVEDSVSVFAADDDCGQALDVSVSEKEVTVTSGSDGSAYIVYYLAEKSTGVQTVSFNSKKYPKAFTAYGETLYKTENDELLPYRITAYKAVPQSNFTASWSNTGDPTSLSVVFDLFEDDNGNFFDMSLIEE